MRRFLLILSLVLIVLVVGAAGLAWYLTHDESFLKSQLASNSLKYTGRELGIEGPAKLTLGRVTTLEASGVHFANAAWAGQPDMATVGHLVISVDLRSLFGNRPVFPRLDLRDCKVSLSKNDEGKANWDMFHRDGAEPEPESASLKRKDLPVRLNELAVNNCEVVLSGPDLKLPLDIKVSGLSMQHHADNRWEGNGSGNVNDEAFSFDGWMTPFSALFYGGSLEHEVKASLGDMTFQSSGSVQDAADWSGVNVTAQLKGPEIRDILNEFKLPLFSEGAFDYELKLNTEGRMTKVDLDGDLGTVDISATGELDRLIKPRAGNIHFSVDGPNLGALAKVFGVDGMVEDAFSHETRVTFENDGVQVNKTTLKTDRDLLEVSGHFSTRQGFSGTALEIHFQSDEAGRWTTLLGQPQQLLGPLDLDGTLSSDATGLFSIQAKVSQGATTLEADGALGRLPDALEPNLSIAFSSPDPSHLAAIAGLKMIPAAPLAIKGRFALKHKQLSLDNVNINLAGDQANANGLLMLENRYAGSDLNLDLDIRNTAALGRLFGKNDLPDQPLKLDAVVKPAGNGLSLRVKKGNLGKIRLDLDGRIPDLQEPLVMDGNFDISLPRLSDLSFLFPDTRLPAASFTAQGKIERKGQQLQLEGIDIRLDDNQATIEGILKLEKHYAGSDLNIHLDIRNAGQLARSFGQDGIPDQPLVLDAEVKPEGKGMLFKVLDGNLGDIQMELQGQIADMEHPMGANARFDIALPRLSDISFLVPGRDLPEVPFKASGQLHNEQTQTRLDQVQIEIGEIRATIDGELFPEKRFKLSVQASGQDVSGLAKVFGQTLKPEPFSLATHLEGTPAEFDLKDLQVTLGKSRAQGDLSIGLGDVTRVHGKIDSPYFDISQWTAKEKSAGAEETKPENKYLFDDRPVMSVAELGYNLDLDLSVAKLQLDNTLLEDIEVGLLLTHNLMELSPFTLKGSHGGVFSGKAHLDDRGATPRFHLSLHGKDMRLGLSAVPGQDPRTFPPVELDLLVDGTGETRREMAGSFDGKLRAYYGSGQIAEAGLSILSDFITELFVVLNPFAKTSEYTRLDCAVIAADAVSGKVDVFPVILHTEQLTILSQGNIDLNTEKIDLSFNTKPRKGLGLSAGVLINPLIKVGGTLAAPAIELDPAGTVKSTGLAVATVGISLLAKSMSDRFLSSADPCGDARKEIAQRDSADG